MHTQVSEPLYQTRQEITFLFITAGSQQAKKCWYFSAATTYKWLGPYGAINHFCLQPAHKMNFTVKSSSTADS